jgi:hypothetical protein
MTEGPDELNDAKYSSLGVSSCFIDDETSGHTSSWRGLSAHDLAPMMKPRTFAQRRIEACPFPDPSEPSSRSRSTCKHTILSSEHWRAGICSAAQLSTGMPVKWTKCYSPSTQRVRERFRPVVSHAEIVFERPTRTGRPSLMAAEVRGWRGRQWMT